MNKETLFWLVVTVGALAALGFLLGESDGEPLYNSADERHAIADDCIGSHSGIDRHDHADLRISVLGSFIEIPGDVGLNDGDCTMRPLHTHSEDGRIHAEYRDKTTDLPLEAFFDTWGIHMDETGFDDYRVDDQHEFVMFVTESGGQRTQVFDFGEHIIEDGQLIELVYREIA